MRSIEVLWAEDDDVQYETCSRSLVLYLHEVGVQASIVRAVDGNEVYRHLSDVGVRRRTFDVLIVDLEMPHWSGLDTVRDVAEKWPGLPTIVVSQHTQASEFGRELDVLKQGGRIVGYFPPEPREAWHRAVHESVAMTTPVILHLSDIHFGRFHAFPRIRLEELMAPMLGKIKRATPINLVVVSGDLASVGEQAEFDRAAEFLDAIRVELDVQLSRVVIVPGNHDIYRPEERQRRLQKFVEMLNRFYGSSEEGREVLKRYSRLYAASVGGLSCEARDRDVDVKDWLFSIAAMDELRILVIALNSVTTEDRDIENGEIAVRQLLAVTEELEKLTPPRSEYFRVAVFHHHLFGVPSLETVEGEASRVVRNQALVLHHLIALRIGVIFHGHTHYAAGFRYEPLFRGVEAERSAGINVVSTGTLAGKHRSSAQSYVQFATVRLTWGEGREVASMGVTPYRLGDDRLSWVEGPTVNVAAGGGIRATS